MLGNGQEKWNDSLLKKYSTASWKMSPTILHIFIASEFSSVFCFPRIPNAPLSNLTISCWCDGKTGREARRHRRRSFPLSDLWLLGVPRNDSRRKNGFELLLLSSRTRQWLWLKYQELVFSPRSLPWKPLHLHNTNQIQRISSSIFQSSSW